MDWATKRKIIYAVAAIILAVSFLVYETRTIIFPEPNCFDQKKNGFESDIDCGGTCSLRCNADISMVTVDWTRAIKVSGNVYDFVGMLSNKNINSSPVKISYTFTAFYKNGEVIKTVKGDTIVLVSGSFPVIKQNVLLAEPPSELVLKLTQEPYYTTLENPKISSVRVANFTYEPGDITRIYVDIVNTTRNIYLKLPIRMIAYDEHDNAIAVGENIVPSLDKEETKKVVFVWHSPFSSAPIKVRAYPIISPFSVFR
ncbi:MAG: hypothetical protein NTW35_02830 [Candidatus Nomurabacteria bacterium]|nr:hypothetical protein [Candidatus Nomurabacteria bacterium]